MTSNEWGRVEGMLIARELDPQEVTADLSSRGVVAQLEWFERSPQLLGVSVAVRDGQVGVLEESETDLTPGPIVADLAESLAERFHAEVRLGEVDADHLPASSGASTDDSAGEDEAQTSRVVEIGRTPASSVPLLAALEGIDIADADLTQGLHVMLAELPPERLGWNFGDLPLVSLSISGDEFQAFLVTDEHLEHVVSHNWSMERVLVSGGCSTADLPREIADLVGDRNETDAIAGLIPGADADALFAATDLRGAAAVRAVVSALGLPSAVGDFLLGTVALADVSGTDLHLARGISNAIGRSVDIMLTEPDSPGFPIWDAYRTAAIDRPWIVRVGASMEAAVGATLLALAIRAELPRSGWTKFGGFVGSLMIVDSVAELSLAKYLGLREERRRAQRAEQTDPFGSAAVTD